MIELRDRSATIEVPERWAHRLVKSLDGAQLGHRLIRARHGDNETTCPEDDHLGLLLHLLDIESEAEAVQAKQEQQEVSAAEAEQSGKSLVDLMLKDQVAGLGGRCLVKLTKRDTTKRLPWTKLGAGSPVLLTTSGDTDLSIRGVVSQRDERSIEVATGHPLDESFVGNPIRLDHSSDEIARQRQTAALKRAQAARGDRLSVLRRVLLGEQPPGYRDPVQLSFLDSNLNLPQQKAVAMAIAAEDLAIIHGPPGTGKTTTLVELVRQAVRMEQRVLVCAPSNMAVDNLFERLLAAGEKVVRLGHPARVQPELRSHTLDMLVEQHPDMKLVRKLRKEAYSLFEKAGKFTRAKPLPGVKQEQRAQARSLLDDARRLEAQIIQQILDSATALCATLTGLDSDLLGQRSFDRVVIDEACQTTEPACWIPLLRSDAVVLAGDHCQLPPTVVSPEAEMKGFGISLMERLMGLDGQVAHQLTVQYRMNREIMDFSSEEFYDSSLIAHDSVADHLLQDLAGVGNELITQRALTFIDTAGAGFDDERELPGRSYFNSGEAKVVVAKVSELLAANINPAQIAVVTPYAAQVRYLRSRLGDANLEIDTVDGFQGREKEAIVISLVRSNTNNEIGFLADTRRMNVALTRARRSLIVIGDSATIAANPFYGRLLDYMDRRGAYRTVWEESY